MLCLQHLFLSSLLLLFVMFTFSLLQYVRNYLRIWLLNCQTTRTRIIFVKMRTILPVFSLTLTQPKNTMIFCWWLRSSLTWHLDIKIKLQLFLNITHYPLFILSLSLSTLSLIVPSPNQTSPILHWLLNSCCINFPHFKPPRFLSTGKPGKVLESFRQ